MHHLSFVKKEQKLVSSAKTGIRRPTMIRVLVWFDLLSLKSSAGAISNCQESWLKIDPIKDNIRVMKIQSMTKCIRMVHKISFNLIEYFTLRIFPYFANIATVGNKKTGWKVFSNLTVLVSQFLTVKLCRHSFSKSSRFYTNYNVSWRVYETETYICPPSRRFCHH